MIRRVGCVAPLLNRSYFLYFNYIWDGSLLLGLIIDCWKCLIKEHVSFIHLGGTPMEDSFRFSPIIVSRTSCA